MPDPRYKIATQHRLLTELCIKKLAKYEYIYNMFTFEYVHSVFVDLN